MHESASMGLGHAVALLAAMVVAATLFRRFGLGSVLGYLAAGLLIGPSARGGVRAPPSRRHRPPRGGGLYGASPPRPLNEEQARVVREIGASFGAFAAPQPARRGKVPASVPPPPSRHVRKAELADSIHAVITDSRMKFPVGAKRHLARPQICLL